MPYSKPLPEWKAAGVKPPQSKIDAGYLPGDKPPSAWWNWALYNTYYALQELQTNAVHAEKLGAASGVATLGSDSKLTASQLPAIGSAQITDNSITNNDLATDIKIGSLATLSTAAKSAIVAAINEIKASNDLKIPLSQRGAANGVPTLDGTTKIPTSQLPLVPTANLTDNSVTDAKLATDNKVGSLATLKTSAKTNVVAALNEVDTELSNHIADAIRHITSNERSKWDGAQLTKLTTDAGVAFLPPNDDANLITETGLYSTSNTTANVPLQYGLIFHIKRHSTNYIQSFYQNSSGANYIRTMNGTTWTAWIEQETTTGAQNKVNAHAGDTVKHVTAQEKAGWDNKLDKTAGGTVAAPVRFTGVSANPVILERTGSSANVAQGFKHDGGEKYIGIGSDLKIRVATDANVSVGQPIEYEAGAQSKADAAESAAKAASLPRNDSRVNSADLNTYKTTGMYAIGSPVTNGPSGFAYGSLLVTNSSSDRITQMVFASGQSKVFVRYGTLTTTVWTSWDELATTAVATTSLNGLMSAASLSKLNGIEAGANNYTHPTTHPATMITQDANNQFVKGTDKTNWDGKETTTGAQAKADWAVSTSKNYVNSLGLGSSGQSVSGNDLNSVMETGIYYTSSNTLNVPAGESYGKVLNMTRDSSQPKQHVFQMFYSLSSGKVFTRKSTDNNVTWTPWEQLATMQTASASNDGVMSSGDFTKLAGIATNANNYVHPTSDGNKHVPATGTTNSGKFLEAGSTAGALSWSNIDWSDIVNKPSTFAPSAHGHAMSDITGLATALAGKSDTNHGHSNATTSVSGYQSAADKSKLDGISAGANKTTNPSTNGVIAIDGVNTTVYTHPTGDGNSHVPATGTSSNGKFLKAASSANSATWQTMTIADVSGLQTVLNQMQATKLTDDSGNMFSITGYNLNNILATGFYYGTNLVNAPITGAYLRIWVTMSAGNSGIQLAFASDGRSWMRHLTSGSWSSWQTIYGESNIQTGKVSITPSAANVPTGVVVSFPNTFKGVPIVYTTPSTTVPGTSVTGTGVSDEATGSVKIWLTRANTATTVVNWVAIDSGLS